MVNKVVKDHVFGSIVYYFTVIVSDLCRGSTENKNRNDGKTEDIFGPSICQTYEKGLTQNTEGRRYHILYNGPFSKTKKEVRTG